MSIIKLIILSMLPISELRGAILYSKLIGMNPFLSFLLATGANILVVPFIFLFLEFVHDYLTRYKIYRKVIEFQIKRTRRKIEKHIGTRWEFPALYLLVAIPLPFTGAYTGVLAAWLFKLNRKKSLKAIILGIITAGILMSFGLTLF